MSCPECARFIANIADDQSCWTGDDLDVCRNADDTAPPIRDQPGLELWYNFGSAHPGVFQMAMCDASVRSISFDISPPCMNCLAIAEMVSQSPTFEIVQLNLRAAPVTLRRSIA